jgi:FtsH-binding integral membrane protein
MFKTIDKKEVMMLMGILILWLIEFLAVTFVVAQYRYILMYQVPPFFLILSVVFLVYVNKMKQKQFKPRQEVSLLMAFSMIPLLLSLIFVLLYVYFVKKDVLIFLLIFGSFYLWFLIMKSIILYKIDTKNKTTKMIQHED